jgi:glycosyltransferase involved in cell wall biosynthesis
MIIAFADFCGMKYDVRTVEHTPLGGSESAACYLSRALARLGHQIFLLANVPADGVFERVHCVSTQNSASLPWQNLDAVLCLGRPGNPVEFRRALAARTSLVSWQSHAADQPPVQFLREPAFRDAYDGFAMVSQWQLDKYRQAFAIDPSRMRILRNAVGLAFENQFAPGEAILPHKTQPPLLAYTSTPFRGLDILLEVFPRIRAVMPGTRLRVFSSAAVYQADCARDDAAFGHLYRRCREMDGVEYIGSVPQPQLALALREVSILAYPNTFAETSCISVMEAMASGCRVVTTELAALPETCNGFARLVRPKPTLQEFLSDFLAQTVKVLRETTDEPEQTEQQLRAQVDYINASVTWDRRAKEWEAWLGSLQRK